MRCWTQHVAQSISRSSASAACLDDAGVVFDTEQVECHGRLPSTPGQHFVEVGLVVGHRSPIVVIDFSLCSGVPPACLRLAGHLSAPGADFVLSILYFHDFKEVSATTETAHRFATPQTLETAA